MLATPPPGAPRSGSARSAASRRPARPLLLLLLVLFPAAARATLTLSPGTVTVFPGELSPSVGVDLAFSTQTNPGTGTLEVALPAALQGNTSSVPATVTYSWSGGDSSASTSFRLDTSGGTPPGTYAVTVLDQTLGAGTAVLTLVVEAPGFTFSAAPDPLTLAVGETGGLTVTTQTDPGFVGTIRYEISGLPSFLDPGSSRSATGPSYRPVTLEIAALAGALPGSYPGTLTGTGGGRTVTETVTVVVESAASFNAHLDPDPVELVVGGPPAAAVVITQPDPGFSEAIDYSVVGLPSFILVSGGGVLGPGSYPALPVGFALTAAAVPGSYPGTLRGTTAAGSLDFPFTVLVAAGPVIDAVSPARLVPGSLSVPVRLLGRDFDPGAILSAGAPLVLESGRVLGSGLAEAVVSVPASSPPGLATLTLTNPDGGSDSVDVALVSADSPAAPFSVTAVAVVHPRPGAHVAAGEEVVPRGLLAGTGNGTVVGRWELDGAPFAQFTARVVGGTPAPVTSPVPLPQSTRGAHRVTLVVLEPQRLESDPVTVIQTSRGVSRLQLQAPADRSVLYQDGVEIRWSPVPGATGYRVDLEKLTAREVAGSAGPPRAVRSARTARTRWSPPSLEPGAYAVRVVPLFPGEVEGEPSAGRRVLVLPPILEPQLQQPVRDPETGRLALSWSGGAAGAVYLLELDPGAPGTALYTALARTPRYVLPPSWPEPAPGWRVRVTAHGPDGRLLGRSGWVDLGPLPAGGPSGFAPASAETPEILGVQPSDGAVVAHGKPEIVASWSGTVDPGAVRLHVDGADVTQLVELGPDGLRYVPFFALEAGEHRVELFAGGMEVGWSFRVEEGAAAAEAEPETAASYLWDVALEGIVATFGGDDPGEDEALAALSAQGEMARQGETPDGGSGRRLSVSGDAGWRQPLEGGDVDQENESWLLEGRLGQRRRAILVAGYGGPRFLDRSEYASAGLARGGVEGEIGASLVSLAYHDSFDPELGGVGSGSFGPEQELRAAALRFGGDSRRFDLRAVYLEVEEEASFFVPERRGTVSGLLGVLRLGGGLELELEGVRGDLEEGGETREGDAYRLGLAGSRGSLDWSVDLRHVEADFVNAANPGLTPGGRGDRDELEISLNRSMRRSRLSATVARYQGGDAFGPEGAISTGDVSFNRRFGEKLSLTVAGNLSDIDADGDEGLFTPPVRQQDWGLRLSLEERLGSLQVGQLLTFQRLEDEVEPEAGTDTSSAELSLRGTLGARLRLNGALGGARVEGGAFAGRTDSWTLYLQPAWEVEEAWLSILPYLSYGGLENDLFLLDTTTELYQLRLAWNPPWAGSLLGLEVSGQWSRSRSAGFEDPGFQESYALTLTLGWGREGTGAFRPPPPPVAGSGPGFRSHV